MVIKHILLTGGAGYIGSHTCVALVQAGYTPVIVDRAFCIIKNKEMHHAPTY